LEGKKFDDEGDLLNAALCYDQAMELNFYKAKYSHFRKFIIQSGKVHEKLL